VKFIRKCKHWFYTRSDLLGGGPTPLRVVQNPIRWATEFSWSLDGTEWRPVADNLSLRIELNPVPRLTEQAADFVQKEALGDLDEPLAHELLREATMNRKSNLRSSLVLAVAAAEVGFKQFATKALPDSGWILSLPAPPLVDMLSSFPWAKLNFQVNGKLLSAIPDVIKRDMKKWVGIRNKIVHAGSVILTSETLDSALTSIRDLLYFLDAIGGQAWAVNYISSEILNQIA
jgi:hypothetical protein